ncbi:MAG: hypothetical protein U0166_21115 [Acidobacteriota bacterium]
MAGPVGRSATEGRGERFFSHLLPSPRDVLLVAALLTPIAVHVPDYDAFWHLKTGDLILATHHVPVTDPFSFTARGRPWIAHEWVPEVLFAALVRAAGLDALVFLKSVLFTATLAILWGILGASLGRFPLARLFVCLMVFASLVPTLTARPWMLSFVLLPLLSMAFLARGPSWRRSAFVLGLLLAVWMNVHGMFVIGYLWLGLQVVGALTDRLRGVTIDRAWDLFRPVAGMAIGTLGALVHPARLAVLTYPLEYQFSKTHDTILEWQPVDMQGAYGRFLLAAFALGLVALARAGAGGAAWWTFSVFSYLAFTSRRNISVMSLACAPFVAQAVATLLSRPRGDGGVTRFLWRRFDNFNEVALRFARSIYAAILAVFLAVFFLFLNPLPADALFKTPSFDRLFPVEAVRWMRSQPDAAAHRIFNFYGWGGYLISEGIPTFIDGRADLYGLAMMQDYHAVMGAGQDWRAVLERHHVDMVLVPGGSVLGQVLARDPGWVMVHADPTAMVFRRPPAP